MKYLVLLFLVLPVGSPAMLRPEPLFQVAAALSMRQGSRPTMEDRAIMFAHAPTPFFAVYDGHCGATAATFACDNLHTILKEKLARRTTESIPEILKNTFEQTDKLLAQLQVSGGSTAVVALLEKNQLHIAFVGDSRAIIIRDSKVLLETLDHKPHADGERDRIVSAGHSVSECVDLFGDKTSRLMPDGFAMSRALGNHTYACKKDKAMTGEPEIISISIEPNDLLLLGTDGLYDDLPTEEIAGIINMCKKMPNFILRRKIIDSQWYSNEHIFAEGDNSKLEHIASYLRDEALVKCRNDSPDNITVMLAEFKAK